MIMGNFKLEIEGLKTYYFLDEGLLKAVDGINLHLQKKEVVGIIGESGCGKSVLVKSIMRIIQKPGYHISGKINLEIDNNVITDLANLNPTGKEIRKIRGKIISMIFQEPMTSLSPVHTIGSQIIETIILHRNSNKNEAKEIAFDMIDAVGIPNPKQRFYEYPYQFSGGMRQRAMIAMALSCNPSILIADEPTTALDVTVQAQILELIDKLKDIYGTSIIYITHDLGVIAETSDKVYVMYLGKIVEISNVKEIFNEPKHPYTKALINSIPRIDKEANKLEPIEGNVPVPINLEWKCGFSNRCEFVTSKCLKSVPALSGSEEHKVSCFLYSDIEENKDEWSQI